MTLKQRGNLLSCLGTIIIMISLIYMMLNISSADSFIYKWGTSIGIGTSLAFWGCISLIISKRKS